MTGKHSRERISADIKQYFVKYDANRGEWSVKSQLTKSDIFSTNEHPFPNIDLYYFTVMAENQVDALVKAEIKLKRRWYGGRITKSPDELWRKDLGISPPI